MLGSLKPKYNGSIFLYPISKYIIVHLVNNMVQMEVGYARVSTQEQNLDLQLDAFAKNGITKIFTDKVSGVKSEKPEPQQLLNYIRQGDTLVVLRLDRLGRTTVQLIQFIEGLKEKGINIKSLLEPIDTTTATLIVQISQLKYP